MSLLYVGQIPVRSLLTLYIFVLFHDFAMTRISLLC